MKNLNEKQKILIRIIIISIFISIVTTSYAYFTASVNSNSVDNVITTGSMRLEFSDGPIVTANNLFPGQNITKTFKVKNIGTIETTYDVYFSEIINSFKDKNDLVYTITSTNGCSKEESVVPFASGEDSKIINNCSIQTNETHEYILTITFKDDGTAQDDNLNQEFQAKISINDYVVEQDIAYINNIIESANNYYNTNKNNQSLLSKNIIDSISSEHESNDQVIVTKDGLIELSMYRNNRCYRKEAKKSEVEIIDNDLCNANISGFVSNNGQLHVSGQKIMNERNEEIRLVGASATDFTFEEIQRTEESFNTLKLWGSNIVRYFMNADISWGLSYVKDPDKNMEELDKVIANVKQNDMYLIISWSGVNTNGLAYTSYAQDFFTRLAQKYPNDPNLIYEIWNEPESYNTWAQITDYSNQIIPAIREISPNTIVLVGTPAFDTNLSVVIGHELSYSNIMYTHHMYMSSFNSDKVTELENAINAGLPIFESEWGTQTTEKYGKSLVRPLAETYVTLLDKYNLSYAMFMFGNHNNRDYSHFDIYKTAWNEKLPKSLLTDTGLFMRNTINGQRNFQTATLVENSSATGNYYRSNEYKDKIVSIEFKNELNVPNDAVVTWDLSLAQNNQIIGYLLNTEETDRYKLIIASNERIYSPSNSDYLFAELTNLKSIDFTNFNTDYMTSMSSMFKNDSALETLDLSSFNTEKLTYMWTTFYNCINLKSINFDNWNPKLTGLGTTFYRCENLEYLDLRNLNVDGVKAFNSLFEGATKLKEINISTWNPTTLNEMKNTFAWCRALQKVDMSNMNITSSTNINNIFSTTPSNVEVKVKDSYVANKLIDAGYSSFTYRY